MIYALLGRRDVLNIVRSYIQNALGKLVRVARALGVLSYHPPIVPIRGSGDKLWENSN